ncbi:MAG: ligase-associated DNA damage response endonuclease PdeM [Marinicaulis sp.]|nr:ligase-associated DNA damage response endonuclease PdeM [Marinicaulis sp.]NNE41101.1 ligase-associated DNA damage response endonuclease PdeM [Marinicaulis sp.]NNL89468.1 ligase-associated DNA damage response endonuclease PdeM [Marinicaulis sp.]
MSNAEFILAGEAVTPDPLGGLYWPREGTLVISDLHLEKGSSFATRGVMLPPYDTRTTITRLKALIRRYWPQRIISLGDAFHDGDAEFRMDDEDASALADIVASVDWLWILGNHDPAPPKAFSGAVDAEAQIGPFTFRHEPAGRSYQGEIAGHLHPCARIASEGRILRRRCFATDGKRMIMPALGAYTGGLNVLDEAYTPIFARLEAWVIGSEGVYPISRSLLVEDPMRRRAG